MNLENPPQPIIPSLNQVASDGRENKSSQNRLAYFAARFGFGFTSAYLFLYTFPFPFSLLPFTDSLFDRYYALWQRLASWAWSNLLHLREPITRFSVGQGDTTYDLIRLLCIAVLAVLFAFGWSFWQRNRFRQAQAHEWMRAYLRLALSCAVIAYGANKAIPVQFDLPLDRLLQPIGDASPMGLLWTFMGASASYTIFTGIAEMTAGCLLISRRTTPGGALLCIAVLSNVVMLNFSYDVPVKLFSSHLLAMAIYLAVPDLKRFANLMLLNRPAYPTEHPPLFRQIWLNRCELITRTVFVLFVAITMLQASYSSLSRPKSPLHGIWLVEEFLLDDAAMLDVSANESRWHRVILDQPWIFAIQFMNGSRERFYLELDTTNRTFSLRGMDGPRSKTQLSYERIEPGVINLKGDLEGHKIEAKLRLTDVPEFRLTSRGFHWISESHFNR